MLLGKNTSVGIDLGTTGCRAVEMAWRGGRPVIERWAAFDFDSQVTDWSNVDSDDLGSMLKATLDKHGIHAYWASHAVAGESVAPQYFNFPKLLPEDVEEAVRIEVEAGLPFRAENALVSYVLFPDQRNGVMAAVGGGAAQAGDVDPIELGPDQQPEQNRVRTHGLAIAADCEFVDARLGILRKAGLETFCVETDASACCNAFLATNDDDLSDKTLAILNIGRRYSNLAILSNGSLLVRDIPVGGKQITHAIAELLGVSEKAAEELKLTHWEKGPQAAETLGDRAEEALRFSLQDLLDRLQDTIQYWVSEQRVPVLERVLLTGGGSLMRDLPGLLSGALGVSVEHWCPFPETANGKKSEWEPWRYRMSVACGLALRRFPRRGR